MRARLSGRSAAARLIDPSVLARIDNLAVIARGVVDGFLHGLHRSPNLGISLDFAEHRAYEPGDDLRRIDWRVFARTDRYHVRQFEAETNADVTLLVDVSASMGYGGSDGARRGSGGGPTKLGYAAMLAACLAYFSARQRDRVGVVLFSDDIRARIAPSARRLDEVFHTLAGARAEGAGALGLPLRKTAELLRRRGLVVLISDLYEPPDEVLGAVRRLRARGNDLIVFHVLDHAELAFPFHAVTTFRDAETGVELPVAADALAERYRTSIRAHTDELARLFAGERIDYTLLDSAEPLDRALFAYLTLRHRMSRQSRGTRR